MERILNQFSKAVLSAVNGNRAPPEDILRYALLDLAKLEVRPLRMAEIAYEWCSMICGNLTNFDSWVSILLACLEVGFRHLDPWQPSANITLTHTEHHRQLIDIVFKYPQSEAIADLLEALTLNHSFSGQEDALVDACARHLVTLHDLAPFSPRLRRLVIRFIETFGYLGFKGAGVEGLIELLDHLHVTAEEMDWDNKWKSLLLDVIWSSEGTQRLSHWYWELLVELAIWESRLPGFKDIDALKIAKSLIDTQEWDKLECWIRIVWLSSSSLGVVRVTEENLESSMLSLFCQRPGAAQELQKWMEEWSQRRGRDIPESFQRILTQAHEAVERQVAP